MEHSNLHLNKTELSNRTLWFDGDCTVTPEQVTEFLDIVATSNNNLFVTEMTNEIKQYNMLVDPSKQIKVKNNVTLPDVSEWNIPEEYLNINIDEYLLDLCATECDKQGWLDDNKYRKKVVQRYRRIEKEMFLYKKFNLLPVLRTIIFIINTLRTQKIVWGIGRGSSVSSYVLYLIGAHDVDSVEYDIEISDFLR